MKRKSNLPRNHKAAQGMAVPQAAKTNGRDADGVEVPITPHVSTARPARGAVVAGIQTPHTSRKLDRARRTVRRYAAWKRTNRTAFGVMEGMALAAAADGRPVHAQELAEWVRAHDYTDAHGRRTVWDNNNTAALARDLEQLHPAELAGRFERRRCVLDALGVTEFRALMLGA